MRGIASGGIPTPVSFTSSRRLNCSSGVLCDVISKQACNDKQRNVVQRNQHRSMSPCCWFRHAMWCVRKSSNLCRNHVYLMAELRLKRVISCSSDCSRGTHTDGGALAGLPLLLRNSRITFGTPKFYRVDALNHTIARICNRCNYVRVS
eukprot:19161-Heterococcus_DN1.PRE.1